jgi:hypothetical protein
MKFKPDNFKSDHIDLSLSKRWSFIQAECNCFCGALENVRKRKLSGHGVSELVRCFLHVLISLCERLASFDLLTNFGYRFHKL